jgi:hypothetical protein
MVFMVVGCSGCATLAPGADPVVVRAEQTLSASLDVTTALLTLEKDHPATFDAAIPGAHKVAEDLRVKFPPAYHEGERLLETYKANKSIDNKVTLTTALAVVTQLTESAQKLLAAYGGGK